MPRIMSIWLHQLPLDRFVRKEDQRLSGPFSVISEQKNAWRITFPNMKALKLGVAAGQSLSDARAICPDLLTEPSDPVREDFLLRALWRWADCLSPRVALSKPDELLLDITGCAHLFGGEDQMGGHALGRLSDLRVSARIGIADTKMAAQALARFGPEAVTIAYTGRTTEALSGLPLDALALDKRLTTDLARTGLTKIGQLYDMKSSELARRFGLGLTKSLGALLGHAPDPITPKAADPVYAARMTLPEPIGFMDDLETVLQRLAERVCDRLEASQMGARRFHYTVRCVDTGDHQIDIGFARPCFKTEPVIRQFLHPLSKLKIEYGADWFRLSTSEIEPIKQRQMAIGEEEKKHDHRFQLIETLGNRIGFDHVRVFKQTDSHIPEFEFQQVEAVDHRRHKWTKTRRQRPIRLFKPPEWVNVETAGRPPLSFKWRRMRFETEFARGPERLTPRWHIDTDLRTRDYWTVQTQQGRRLWLINYPGDEDESWYVAGEFA